MLTSDVSATTEHAHISPVSYQKCFSVNCFKMKSQQRTVLLNLPELRPINIEFENITLSVKNEQGKGKKQIIKGVSGQFRSGELTAIMGPSGAGKSTLLDVLTGFQNDGMGGIIRNNGVERCIKTKEGAFKKESCYILQDDRLCPLFTVHEIMTMAAELKLGYSLSFKAKLILISEILKKIGLTKSRDTRCAGLSGGQKKRLSIALELIDNPPVMFLDEPTTGLDSLSTIQCITMLKTLAGDGRTIVCTIHQPSATVYRMFDHVYVLAEGLCIYQGTSHNTVPYLDSVGLKCPQYHSPADFLLEVASGDFGNFNQHLSIAAQDNYWRSRRMSKLVEEVSSRENNSPDPDADKTTVLINQPSEFNRFLILINRNSIQLYRDWTVTHLKLLLHLLVGLLLGLNFTESGDDGSKTLANIGFLFSTIIYISYTSMMPAILRFPAELSVMKKETFNNWYKLRTYYTAFLMTNTPLQLTYCTVFVAVSYYLSGQPLMWSRFTMYWAICFLTSLTAESVGLYLGTMDNLIYALFFGSVFTAYLLAYSGCLVLFPQMSSFLYAFSYLSFSRYSFAGLMLAVYGYGREGLYCPEEMTYCHLKIPSKILVELGIEDNTYWINFIVLVVMTLAVRILAFVALKKKITSSS